MSVKTLYKKLLIFGLTLGPTIVFAQEFADCILSLQHQAKKEGVPAEMIETVLGELEYVPRVIELDRRQPEFTETFANYFNKRVTDKQVKRGRTLLVKHKGLLRRLTTLYGVPAQYLIAFWGLETNYGNYLGRMPVLDSLATLACDQRRSAFFTLELFEALRLMDQFGFPPKHMRGSWAGAMGHTQFMPSAYRQYARDGDGDGRVDLWQSETDALTSAANFLLALGWQSGLRWGREVKLPEDYFLSDMAKRSEHSLQEWKRLGVKTADGFGLPDLPLKASLIVPAGHRGPAFLVYENFEVILRWNRSQFYGIAVGVMADRINGAGKLRFPPPADAPRLSRTDVEALQRRMQERGIHNGAVDGILGPDTRRSIQALQSAHKIIADGYPNEDVFKLLELHLNNSQ